MNAEPPTGKKEDKEGKSPNNYLRYSGLGLQMLVSIVAGFFLGQFLDNFLETNNPWFTIAFIFIFFLGSMVLLIKQISSK